MVSKINEYNSKIKADNDHADRQADIINQAKQKLEDIMNNRSPSSSRVESSAERSTSRMKKRPFRKVVKQTLHTKVDRDVEGGIILKKMIPEKRIVKVSESANEQEAAEQLFPSIKRVMSRGKP